MMVDPEMAWIYVLNWRGIICHYIILFVADFLNGETPGSLEKLR